VRTSIYVGNESSTVLFVVFTVPVLLASMVKVKLSFTLAWVGVTDTFRDGIPACVPVGVGEGVIVDVATEPVTVGVAVDVAVEVDVDVD
jgi:hypothetical protein